MNYSTEPPKPVKVLIGIAAVMAILLSGVTLGVLSDENPVTRIPDREAGEPRVSQEQQEEGLTRPVMHLDGADRREANRSTMGPCQQGKPAPGEQEADAASEPCSPQPMQIDTQKLLVLIALWRFMS